MDQTDYHLENEESLTEDSEPPSKNEDECIENNRTRSRITETTFLKKTLFNEVPDSLWDDWKWQISNRIKDAETLQKYLILTEKEQSALFRENPRSFAITPYYLCRTLISTEIRKTVIPTEEEYYVSLNERVDPLDEEGHSPVPGILVHRYPDRVLLLVSSFCSTLCRYWDTWRLFFLKQ